MARRLSPDFVERVHELEGTNRARLASAQTGWALRSAAHIGDDAFAALGRSVTSSPARMAGLLSGDHDPLLVCALAGKRSMQDLAGVTPGGGRSKVPSTALELAAARAVRKHWELCQTEPERAKRLEARWTAARTTMRSGHLGSALSAMEATFGAGCSAEREAAQGRLVSTVPPAGWEPKGACAGKLAGYGNARWDRMRSQAVAETQLPADWRHRRSSASHERPRTRFVARGAGRLQQLADRSFSPRMAVSRIAFEFRLKRAMNKGPAATRRFLTAVASNPRRAAAAVRARLDPMVAAAAIGPRAIEGMLAGRPVEQPGPLGRLQAELHRRDLARLEEVRVPDPSDLSSPDRAGAGAQRDAVDGGLAAARGMREASARFVDKVWRGDARGGGRGGAWSADSDLGQAFQQGHVEGSVYDAWRERREAVVDGAGAAELDRKFGVERWMLEDTAAVDSAEHLDLIRRLDELGGEAAGYRLRTDPDLSMAVLERQDLMQSRGEVDRERAGVSDDWSHGVVDEGGQVSAPDGQRSPSSAEADERSVDDELSGQQHARPGRPGPPAPASPDPGGAGDVPAVSVVIPAAALRDVEVKEEDLPRMTQEAAPPPRGSWKVHDDDLVDRVIPREDGSYEVQFKPGVVAPAEGLAERAASETHKRRTDPALVARQNERTEKTVELERAAQETLAEAVEHGRAPFDVERQGYMPGQATDAFSQEPVGGLDGDLLRAKALKEGRADDLRFATREQIEDAGGRLRKDADGREAEGVVVMREVSVSAQPFGKDGKVDRDADPVEYRVKAPVVVYHVATAADIEPGKLPRESPQAAVPEMTAEDLCHGVGVNTLRTGQSGRSEFQPKTPQPGISSDTIAIGADAGESVAERNGRLVGAAVRAAMSRNRAADDPRLAPASKGTYSGDPAKRRAEERLVEVLAADRAASRIGVAYRTSPPVTAEERKTFSGMLKDPSTRQRLGAEAERVSRWVADGAKDRLHARGMQTVQERAQGQPAPASGRGRQGKERDEPAYSR